MPPVTLVELVSPNLIRIRLVIVREVQDRMKL